MDPPLKPHVLSVFIMLNGLHAFIFPTARKGSIRSSYSSRAFPHFTAKTSDCIERKGKHILPHLFHYIQKLSLDGLCNRPCICILITPSVLLLTVSTLTQFEFFLLRQGHEMALQNSILHIKRLLYFSKHWVYHKKERFNS